MEELPLDLIAQYKHSRKINEHKVRNAHNLEDLVKIKIAPYYKGGFNSKLDPLYFNIETPIALSHNLGVRSEYNSNSKMTDHLYSQSFYGGAPGREGEEGVLEKKGVRQMLNELGELLRESTIITEHPKIQNPFNVYENEKETLDQTTLSPEDSVDEGYIPQQIPSRSNSKPATPLNNQKAWKVSNIKTLLPSNHRQMGRRKQNQNKGSGVKEAAKIMFQEYKEREEKERMQIHQMLHNNQHLIR